MEWTIDNIGISTGIGFAWNPIHNILAIGHNLRDNVTRRGWSLYSDDGVSPTLLNSFFTTGLYPHVSSVSEDGDFIALGTNGSARVYNVGSNTITTVSSGNIRFNALSPDNGFHFRSLSTNAAVTRLDYPSLTNQAAAGSISFADIQGHAIRNGQYGGEWIYHRGAINDATLHFIRWVEATNSITRWTTLNCGANIIHYTIDKDDNLFVYHVLTSGNFLSKFDSSRGLVWRTGSSVPGTITIPSGNGYRLCALVNNEQEILIGMQDARVLRFDTSTGDYLGDTTFPGADVTILFEGLGISSIYK
jgi:hypothetical protein